MEASTTGGQPLSRPGDQPDERAHGRRHHQPRQRRNHGSPIHEDHMMPTSLTLDTMPSDDGKLVLIAAGEIDLSNIDVFDQALTTAAADAVSSGGKLTVDLSAVEYLDSAAINALFGRADHIQLIASS